MYGGFHRDLSRMNCRVRYAPLLGEGSVSRHRTGATQGQ